jgi:hypothetical protein
MRASVAAGVAISVLLLPGLLPAQRSRSTQRKQPAGKIQDIPIPPVTMRGTLRQVDKKQILMDTPDDQVVTFRRVKKTKFLKGSKEIAEVEFHPGAAIVVEATREPDGEFDAIHVYLGEPPPAPASPS